MRKVLVCKRTTIDRLSARSIAFCKVCSTVSNVLLRGMDVTKGTSSLDHEIRDRAVDDTILVVQWPI